MRKEFEKKKFDVEHALNMYASSFFVMPAFAIYEENLLKQFKEITRTCHIYLIGRVPRLNLIDVRQDGAELVTSFESLGKRTDLRWPLPVGTSVAGDGASGWYVVDKKGSKSFPSEEAIATRLRSKGIFDFEVLYIGQAFGDGGSRSALDRLKKHETLQKISLQGISSQYVLTVLLLEIVPANRLITMFNPFAMDKAHGQERIEKGFEKLRDTTEAERTTLYEASLIRYFQPKFNIEFKNSFPSTNMKCLTDCYKKDIAAVTAEIYFDNLPYRLYSSAVKPSDHHIAHHDLHDSDARKVFFMQAG